MTDSVSVLEAVVRRDLYFILFGTGELESELEELNRRRSGKSFFVFEGGTMKIHFALSIDGIRRCIGIGVKINGPPE